MTDRIPEQFFKAYQEWAEGIWDTKPGTLREARDVSIMGLGLLGETGEVHEKLLSSERGSLDALLKKELGDVFYYFAIISQAFHFCIPSANASSTNVDIPTAISYMPRLYLDAARIAEVLKKDIRDVKTSKIQIAPEVRLKPLLQSYYEGWLAIVASTPWSVSDILEDNQQKLESRRSRGVLQGSGDER